MGSQFSVCRDANTAAPRERSQITDEPRTAEQVQEGAGQRKADSEQEGKRARRRSGRRRDVDGSRSARRGDSQTHFESADQSGHQTRAATHIPGIGPELRVLHGDGKSRTDQHDDTGQSSLAPEVRGRHRNHVSASNTVGSPTPRRDSRRSKPTPKLSRPRAEAAHWITRSLLQWAYTEWNAEQKKALPPSRDNLSHEEAKRAVNNLLKITAKDDIVHRFQSLKPLKPELQAEVVVMLLTLTLRQKGEEIQKDLDLLADNSVGKVVGLRLRRERVSKTALAKELEKLRL